MRFIISGGMLVFVAIAGWRIGGELSPDALGMAVGLLFGVMAGIPTALILLASQRRAGEWREERPRVALMAPRETAPITEVHHHYCISVSPHSNREEEQGGSRGFSSMSVPASRKAQAHRFRVADGNVESEQ